MDTQLLEHLKTYLQLHHDQNDGGVYINLIARINDELERIEKTPFSNFSDIEINEEWGMRVAKFWGKL